ncbi:MlaA family lipoprotein [Sphingobium fuliginis]|uniref:VacJ family lipoprotein n=1 Tax=Sphingobium fuliginis ATCC 27551 TaxID=1208342 RepID=A0A5B8CED0_SPHSA|nr:VacJ family lipoprotein [Sphingobium fuliginis]QDC37898.1 VacJ family lipoprotein [Sphingobium fuliginis ATCC 27551]
MLTPAIAAGMLMMGAQAGTEGAAASDPAAVAAPAPDAPAAPQAAAGGTPQVLVVPPPPVMPNLPGTDAPAAAAPQPGEIVVTGHSRPPPGDPLERLNEKSFQTVQAVDKAVLEPVAKAYNKGLPKPARKGLRNFFSNLQEPVVFLAYMLQFKPGKAMETVGRFTINTTLGVAGLFDVAKRKPFFLPYRPNGLANVLGYYGVGPGPYMYLPIVGPTTLRDIVGDTVDKLVVPFAVGKPFNEPKYVIPATILNQLGERAAFDETIQQIRSEENPYAYYRELYLKQRKAEIEALHGRTVEEPVTPVYGPGLGKAPPPETVPAPEPIPTPTP